VRNARAAWVSSYLHHRWDIVVPRDPSVRSCGCQDPFSHLGTIRERTISATLRATVEWCRCSTAKLCSASAAPEEGLEQDAARSRHSGPRLRVSASGALSLSRCEKRR